MRYWSYLAAKLLAVLLVVSGLRLLVERYLPKPTPSRYGAQPLFLHDMPFTFAMLAIWLATVGLIYLAFWDQRRRCRTCLRRLIMPVTTGSWSNMLTFGRPRIEWMCPYGHGTLKIEELQITGKEPANWEASESDIWKELESYGPKR